MVAFNEGDVPSESLDDTMRRGREIIRSQLPKINHIADHIVKDPGGVLADEGDRALVALVLHTLIGEALVYLREGGEK